MLNRREMFQGAGLGAIMCYPVIAKSKLQASMMLKPEASKLPQTNITDTQPCPIDKPFEFHHEPKTRHHNPIQNKLDHTKAQVAHNHKRPHEKAHNLRAIRTLDTPGNRRDLALTMWGEARGYGELGMRCVGHVIMNRVKAEHAAFGYGVHGVCHKRKQFSCWNHTSDHCDPNYARMNDLYTTMEHTDPDWIAFVTADKLAARILSGADKDNTGGATFYFNADIVSPYWLKDMEVVGVMFGHTFCKQKKPHHTTKKHHETKHKSEHKKIHSFRHDATNRHSSNPFHTKLHYA